jgi:hypothetical protein
MPTSALTPYIPFIMIIVPLAAVYLASRFAECQRRMDEDRRRRALATFLLNEIQLLYTILKDIRLAYFLKALHTRAIEPFHTAMYDQAGSDRLLFQAETAQLLAQFYSLVHTLRTELNQFRELPPEHRTAQEQALLVRTLYTAELITDRCIFSLTFAHVVSSAYGPNTWLAQDLERRAPQAGAGTQAMRVETV